MRCLRASVAVLVAVGLGLSSSVGLAEPLWVDGEPASLGGCNLIRAEVWRWSPQHGAPADYVARRFVGNGGQNTLILLGFDASGLWAAEMNTQTDACDDCDVLSLSHTGFDGARTSYLVADSSKLVERSPQARLDRVKRSLFMLAAGPWPATRLSQRYRLALPKHDAEGRLARYTGWVADVRAPGQPALRIGVQETSVMCWCAPHWRSYALRP